MWVVVRAQARRVRGCSSLIAIQVHNNKAHKFYPSQKSTGMGIPMIGRGTPARSQALVANGLQTPSRSPGRNQRSPRSNRHWQAEMMPPPAPPAFVDPNRFKTPQTASRIGPSQRKMVPPKSAPSPGFRMLQDSFSVDPDIESSRMTKRPKQSRMSMTPAFGEDENDMPLGFSPPRHKGNDNDGFEMDFAPLPLKSPLAGIDEPDEFQIRRSDADLRGEVSFGVSVCVQVDDSLTFRSASRTGHPYPLPSRLCTSNRGTRALPNDKHTTDIEYATDPHVFGRASGLFRCCLQRHMGNTRRQSSAGQGYLFESVDSPSYGHCVVRRVSTCELARKSNVDRSANTLRLH